MPKPKSWNYSSGRADLCAPGACQFIARTWWRRCLATLVTDYLLSCSVEESRPLRRPQTPGQPCSVCQPVSVKRNWHPLTGSTTQFKIETDGQNRMGLAEVCRRFADSLLLPAHVTHDEAAEIAIDLFKRTVAGELERPILRKCRRMKC